MNLQKICNACATKNLRRATGDPEIIKCTIGINSNHQSFKDLPAKEYSDGSKVWCNDGLCHRSKNLPAFICYCKECGGSNVYAVKGKIHRTDGPAVEQINEPFAKKWYLEGNEMSEKEFIAKTKSNVQYDEGSGIPNNYGNKRWYLNGKLHRLDGPAIEDANGDRYWYLNDERHRTDGPAIEFTSGYKAWYLNDELHREDGPAVEFANGDKYWYLNDKELTEEEFIAKTKSNVQYDEGSGIPDEYGDKYWLLNGERHRTDGPAIEYVNGIKLWYLNDQKLSEEELNLKMNKISKTSGVTIKEYDGHTKWYLDGDLHKEDGPAVIYSNGTKEYWKNGVPHRLDGPAVESRWGANHWWIDGKSFTELEYKTEIAQRKIVIMKNDKIKYDPGSGIPDKYGDKYWYLNGKHHREDGPAVEWANGTKMWYVNDERHREDGPAVEDANGSKDWFVNGNRHREDGPAIEDANGDKSWYLNGLLHRTDGPAIEQKNGYKEWLLNGIWHREDGPALEWADGDKLWYLHGKLLTEEEFNKKTKPKVKYDKGSGVLSPLGHKRWHVNGNLHRTDGPAIEWCGGDKWWYLNGNLHRTDGPAIENANGEKSWWLNGELHRTDGPATESVNGTKHWFVNGKRHRTDGPATENSDGDKYWRVNGKLHRTDGPAIEFANGDKCWYLNNEYHREDGPAIERTDGDKFWYLNGKYHRIDGPAVEDSNGTKEWYLNGKKHRTDGPAIKLACGHKHWYVNNKRHREDGPASEYASGHRYWFLNGEELTEKAFIAKTKKINKKEKIMTNTLQSQITQSLSNSHSWRQAVVDTVDILARNGICFSSGEIARHIRIERPDIQFSFFQIGLMLKDLFADGDTMSFFDGKVPAVRTIRQNSDSENVYVYGPSMHLCETHDFEIEVPTSTPTLVPTTPSIAQRQTTVSPPSNISTPLWQRPRITTSRTATTVTPQTISRSRQANESTAVIHSDGRLAIPSMALQKLNVRPGDTVSFRTTNFGAGRTLEIARGNRHGWESKKVSSNKGRAGRLYFGQRDVGTHQQGATKSINYQSFENMLFVTL